MTKAAILGNPILDLQVEVGDDFLKAHSLESNKVTVAKDESIFESIKGAAKVQPGGLHVVAKSAQQLLPKNSVVSFGSIGDDDKTILESDKEAGVQSNYQVEKGISTGKSITFNTGQHRRSQVIYLGAAEQFKLNYLQDNWQHILDADVYYVDGLHVASCPEAMNAIGHYSSDEDKSYCINLSIPSADYKDAMDYNSQYWDYCIATETQALAYARAHNLNTEDPEEIAKSIASLPKQNTSRPRIVIVSNSSKTISATADSITGEINVERYSAVPSDINSFSGRFLAAVAQEKDLATSIEIGNGK